jgi:hypothetical protein
VLSANRQDQQDNDHQSLSIVGNISNRFLGRRQLDGLSDLLGNEEPQDTRLFFQSSLLDNFSKGDLAGVERILQQYLPHFDNFDAINLEVIEALNHGELDATHIEPTSLFLITQFLVGQVRADVIRGSRTALRSVRAMLALSFVVAATGYINELRNQNRALQEGLPQGTYEWLEAIRAALSENRPARHYGPGLLLVQHVLDEEGALEGFQQLYVRSTDAGHGSGQDLQRDDLLLLERVLAILDDKLKNLFNNMNLDYLSQWASNIRRDFNRDWYPQALIRSGAVILHVAGNRNGNEESGFPFLEALFGEGSPFLNFPPLHLRVLCSEATSISAGQEILSFRPVSVANSDGCVFETADILSVEEAMASTKSSMQGSGINWSQINTVIVCVGPGTKAMNVGLFLEASRWAFEQDCTLKVVQLRETHQNGAATERVEFDGAVRGLIDDPRAALDAWGWWAREDDEIYKGLSALCDLLFVENTQRNQHLTGLVATLFNVEVPQNSVHQHLLRARLSYIREFLVPYNAWSAVFTSAALIEQSFGNNEELNLWRQGRNLGLFQLRNQNPMTHQPLRNLPRQNELLDCIDEVIEALPEQIPDPNIDIAQFSQTILEKLQELNPAAN